MTVKDCECIPPDACEDCTLGRWVTECGQCAGVAGDVGPLRSALDILMAGATEAAATFRAYEYLHLAKGTDDAYEKSKKNAALALKLETAIAEAKRAVSKDV